MRRLMRQSSKFLDLQKNLKFFILDCRPSEQFQAGHLPCAFHLDPHLVRVVVVVVVCFVLIGTPGTDIGTIAGQAHVAVVDERVPLCPVL